MLLLVGALLLGGIDTTTVSVCESDKEGDSNYEACFGWCDATQAVDHCQWCKVRQWTLRSASHPNIEADSDLFVCSAVAAPGAHC